MRRNGCKPRPRRRPEDFGHGRSCASGLQRRASLPELTTAGATARHGHSLRRYRQPPQSLSPRLRAERRRDRQPSRYFAHRTLPVRERRARQDRDAGKARRAALGLGADLAGRRRRIRRLGGELFRAHAADRGILRAHHRARRPDLLPAGLRRLRSGARRHLAGKHSRRVCRAASARSIRSTSSPRCSVSARTITAGANPAS